MTAVTTSIPEKPLTPFQRLVSQHRQLNGITTITSSSSTTPLSINSPLIERSSLGEIHETLSHQQQTSNIQNIAKRLNFNGVAKSTHSLVGTGSAFVLNPDHKNISTDNRNVIIPISSGPSVRAKPTTTGRQKQKRQRTAPRKPKSMVDENGLRLCDSDGNEGEELDSSKEDEEDDGEYESDFVVDDDDPLEYDSGGDDSEDLVSTDSEIRPKPKKHCSPSSRDRTIELLSSTDDENGVKTGVRDDYDGVVSDSEEDAEDDVSEDSGEESCEFNSDESEDESDFQDDAISSEEEEEEEKVAKNDTLKIAMTRNQKNLFKLLRINDTPTIPGEMSIKNVFGYILSSHLPMFCLLEENVMIDPIDARLKAITSFKLGVQMKFVHNNSVVRAYYIWLKVRDIIRKAIFTSEESKAFSELLADFKTSNKYDLYKLEEETSEKCMLCSTHTATHCMQIYHGESSSTLTFDDECSSIFEFLRLWSFPEICASFVETYVKETYENETADPETKHWIKSDADKRHFFSTHFAFIYHFFFHFYQKILVPLLQKYDLAASYSSNIFLPEKN